MDLNALFHEHQVALMDLAQAETGEARRWAGERADWFAQGLIKERRRIGVSEPTFDYRKFPRAW